MTNSPFDADVIIVGAGPVGLTAAMDLDSRNITSIVIETRAYLEPPNVKCNHVSARTMERFRTLGVAHKVRAAGLPDSYPNDVAFRTSMTGTEIGRIKIPGRADRYTSTNGPDTSWATPEPPHRVNQTFLEPVLNEHVATLSNVQLLNETKYQRFEQSDAGVTVTITDLDGSNERHLTAKYLIGADGGKSNVRKQIGAKLSGDPVLQNVQSTCIRAPKLYDMMPGLPAWGYYTFNTRRNGHVYAIDGQDVFLVHNHLTADEAADGSVDRDASIRAILGVDEDFEYEVISKEDWTARRLVADKFRQDRVFLAGDASHLWVPYAGYGMNAGIADVLNLTWLLGAYLNGWADVAILEVYEAERLPITEQVSKFAMNHQQRIVKSTIPHEIEEDSHAGAQARQRIGQEAYDINVVQFAAAGLNFGYVYDQSPIIFYDGETAPEYSMGAFTPSTVPGTRAPHFWLPDGTSLYDHFGQGYSLIVFDNSVDVAAMISAANQQGIPLSVIDATQADFPAEYRHKLVLVRQDQHVAWRGDAVPADGEEFFETLKGTHISSVAAQH